MIFYSQKKPREFSYRPLYIDEKKLELERKVERARRELNGDESLTPDEVKENLKGAFVRSSRHLRSSGPDAAKKRTSKTLKLILALVLLAVVLILMWRGSLLLF